MRAILQRVKSAEVWIDEKPCAKIATGLLALVGIAADDTEKDVLWMAKKIVHLRVFEDDTKVMNRSLLDIEGSLLLVSQFTLMGDCRKGRRPSWSAAMASGQAKPLFLQLVQVCQRYDIQCATGQFQASMDVQLVNSGPVTLILDSRTA
ncbi:MAG: D-tyrosyl-tRNA(Tyr) deacylase [Desulfobulbus propionicus]|nr:MAG: D-tyrosyl-tRNA(Tyr) deacylase [Desulfobulbus propionicus]